MTLKEARKLAIKYCEENNCSYTYISHDEVSDFYLTDEETRYTVFFVNRNGSLKVCRNGKYAVDFHKELRRRRKHKKNNGKREAAEMFNHIDEENAAD